MIRFLSGLLFAIGVFMAALAAGAVVGGEYILAATYSLLVGAIFLVALDGPKGSGLLRQGNAVVPLDELKDQHLSTSASIGMDELIHHLDDPRQ